MSLNKSREITSIHLREMKVPNDYEQVANLLNIIEPGSTTVESLKEEDSQIPATSLLKRDENGKLVGFGRTRVVAENIEGLIVGYGASFRAPWTDPGQIGSVFCVHPDFRGQGVGNMLLSHIEQWGIDHQASELSSIVMDWIDDSLPFVQKRGFKVDAHIFDLVLDLNQYDNSGFEDSIEHITNSGIKFITLADLQSEDSVQKLYDLCEETFKDNPGQYGSIAPFEEWRKEFLPELVSRNDWVFIAVDGEQFIGVTVILTTEEDGEIYTNYTGVLRSYRGKGIAKALKRLSINTAISYGAHTMLTDAEENNAPMQSINRSLGYIPGKGHYRIIKHL
ncbi:MAG TPA: GNAT family N-acetyltransferase [Ureibacillus sp.]|nr:GNAT family N-acetyltransferase [Ureibacillus sp.]